MFKPNTSEFEGYNSFEKKKSMSGLWVLGSAEFQHKVLDTIMPFTRNVSSNINGSKYWFAIDSVTKIKFALMFNTNVSSYMIFAKTDADAQIIRKNLFKMIEKKHPGMIKEISELGDTRAQQVKGM